MTKHKIKEVYLIGINTGFCVFATALDVFYRMYGLYLFEDAISTMADKKWHERGIERYKEFFGNKSVIRTNSVLKRLWLPH